MKSKPVILLKCTLTEILHHHHIDVNDDETEGDKVACLTIPFRFFL